MKADAARSYDYYFAEGFDLRAYADRAAGTMSQFCIDMGLKHSIAYFWVKNKKCPWRVYERAIAKYGALGFAVPTPRRVSRVPFRLPSHFAAAPAPKQPTSAPAEQSAPLESAMRTLADAIRAELSSLIDSRVDAKLASAREDMKTLEAMILDRLSEAGHSGNGTAAATPMPITPREVRTAPTRPKEPSLTDVLAAVQTKASKIWTSTSHAQREFAKLDPVSRDIYTKTLRDIAEADDTRWWSMFESKKMNDTLAKKMGHPEVWALKASRKLRLFVTRNGAERCVVGFALRGDHRFYGGEK